MAPEAEVDVEEELPPNTVQTQNGFPYHRGSEYTWDLGVSPVGGLEMEEVPPEA
ncbi:MAG: hypothetical protein Unbinned5607contig1000_32 [Prokaryotic dsDNA virus sp.]|nr:MAG: hypothetical protein Unbinned5607contig1000_32 [Prokaryotic dsDNA virus sp.]|tara:strand:+ start:12212 stop:12373 length:162 start_codon:yes stop_codon:yes gene_type:complete